MILVINGSAESGKDSVVKFFREFSNPKFQWAFNISSIDPFCQVARMFGWDGVKTEKSRLFLHELKCAAIKFNDYPTFYIVDEIKGILNDNQNIESIIFVHIREKEEIEKLKHHYPELKTILVRKPDSPEINNYADQNVESMEYDFTIENDGDLESLKKKAYTLYCLLRGKTNGEEII